jgi:hypothetical protein
VSQGDKDGGVPDRDDALEWELHAALSALERVSLPYPAWLRGLDEYYCMRLDGNRAGYLQLARILLRAASERGVNAEYVAADGPNRDLADLLVATSQIRLQLGPRKETAPPRGPVGARTFRAQLPHAAAVWGCGIVAVVALMAAFFLVLAALGVF